jgi:hypothetical protein
MELNIICVGKEKVKQIQLNDAENVTFQTE